MCRVRPRIPSYTVGIDPSEHQLARNRDLQEAIHGQIEAAPIQPEAFDLAVCWNVLEHLGDPTLAIDRLINALRPGGQLLLAWPNVASLKAILARALPYSAHVALERWLYPRANLNDDRGPFRTVLDKRLALNSMLIHMRDQDLALSTLVTYESGSQRKARSRAHLTGASWRIVKSAVSVLSVRSVDPEHTDIVALWTKS